MAYKQAEFTAAGSSRARTRHSSTLQISRRITATAGGTALALALLGLLSWPLHDFLLNCAVPLQLTTIKPNAALALMLLALALVAGLTTRRSSRRGRLARISAAVGAAIGGLTLCEYLAGADLHIDDFMFRHALEALHSSARMAPNTAAGLALVGAAELAMLSGRRAMVVPAQVLALTALMLGQARLYGFIYAAPQLGRFGNYSGMGVSTALALVLLGAGTFLSRPLQGMAALLTDSGATGLLGRWTTSAILVVLPFLGWLQLHGQDAGWYGSRLGTALLVCAGVCVFQLLAFTVLAMAARAERAQGRAEHKLREYAQVKAFMDHAPAVMFIRGLDGRYLAANSLFEEVVGMPAGQVVGARVEDLGSAEAAATARAADAMVRSSGRPMEQEEVVSQSDGDHHYLTTLFPLADDQGDPYAICGVALDVTERVRAKRRAEQLQRRLYGLLEAAPDAMVIANAKGLIVMANAQAATMFGRTADELLDRPVTELMPEELRHQHAHDFHDYRRRPGKRPMGAGLELFAVHRDGRRFPVEISISPLETADGLLVTAAIRDVSGRKQAEAKLRRLHDQQRLIALTLQRSLMGEPKPLPQLHTASRYLASAQEAGVGGDWFDLVPLDGERVGVMIGDVMGRGVHAAAVMGQLRAAAHALAQTGMAPDRLMNALDAFVADLGDQLVTCCYLVLDPDRAEVTICSAGHLPVLVAEPHQAPYPLDAPVSVPLGVGGIVHRQAVHTLPHGATLALFTDGLVETAHSDIDDRIRTLSATLQAGLADRRLADTTTLDSTAALIIDVLIPDVQAHNDDVTLLLVRPPTAPGGSIGLELPIAPRSTGTGRRFLADAMSERHYPPEVVDAACLLASELLTNAVNHARGPIHLELSGTESEVTIEVTDRSRALPAPRDPTDDDEGGRGLLLVDALADEWGTRAHPHGKTVWFTLSCATK